MLHPSKQPSNLPDDGGEGVAAVGLADERHRLPHPYRLPLDVAHDLRPLGRI